jgi:adenylate cyclase
VADRARAEADTLLTSILPEAIAERLKEKPGETVADSVAEASVMFSDLVGFTELAQQLGAERSVALLERVHGLRVDPAASDLSGFCLGTCANFAWLS